MVVVALLVGVAMEAADVRWPGGQASGWCWARSSCWGCRSTGPTGSAEMPTAPRGMPSRSVWSGLGAPPPGSGTVLIRRASPCRDDSIVWPICKARFGKIQTARAQRLNSRGNRGRRSTESFCERSTADPDHVPQEHLRIDCDAELNLHALHPAGPLLDHVPGASCGVLYRTSLVNASGGSWQRSDRSSQAVEDDMPYLVRIGGIDQNLSGVGARGYGVFQKGRTVTVLYGKLEARGGRRTRFYWRSTPQEIGYRRSTIEGARALSRELVREQLLTNASGRYTKLPNGVRIYSASRLSKAS